MDNDKPNEEAPMLNFVKNNMEIEGYKLTEEEEKSVLKEWASKKSSFDPKDEIARSEKSVSEKNKGL
jgi:hypothetical protein